MSDLIQIRCSKCRQKFDRMGVRARRVCDHCLSPGKATQRAVLDQKRLTCQNVAYGHRTHLPVPEHVKVATFPQVTPIEETACTTRKAWHRVVREMEKVRGVAGLEEYARNLAHLAEDIALNDTWSRSDQLRVLGAVLA